MAKKTKGRTLEVGNAETILRDDDAKRTNNAKAVCRFVEVFSRDMPEGAVRSGSYEAKDGDQFHGEQYEIVDGTYRVAGHDWLVTFKGGAFVGAQVANAANQWGGKGVVTI